MQADVITVYKANSKAVQANLYKKYEHVDYSEKDGVISIEYREGQKTGCDRYNLSQWPVVIETAMG